MKIASYNIWNVDKNYKERLSLLSKVLMAENLDILALQEVRDEEAVLALKDKLGFTHHIWRQYSDCQEGLAILSKSEMRLNWTNWDDESDFHNSGLMNASIQIGDYRIGITNVHLDYKRSYYREIELVKAIKRIENQDHDYELILGDFNTYPNSSIHNYLIGTTSLMEHSAQWIDLFDSYSAKYGGLDGTTLDFYNNPRWDTEYALDVPGRFDWIMLKNPYPNKSPELRDFKVLGKDRINNITPSDHYGLACELVLSAK